MRPLIITPLYPPAVGGAATYFGDLVPGLLQRPEVEQITLLTERFPGEPDRVDEGKLSRLRWLPARVGRGRRRWPWHALSYLRTQLWFAYWLPRLARQQQADLIHYHTRYRGRLFFWALRRTGVPLLADLRDKMSDPAQLARASDRLLCCAEGVRDFAVAGGYPAQRIDLVPILFRQPALPTPQQEAQVRRRFQLGQGAFILYVGDITRSKGVYELLAAFDSWRQRHPEVRLALAGPNRLGDAFLTQAGGQPGVHYLDQVGHQTALALMRAAEIVVLPSRSEGLPTVILEAVALGTRVICPPDIPEFAAHLPQYVLPQVSAAAIEQMMDQVWSMTDSPVYPLAAHRLDKVVDGVVAAYGRLRP